MISSTYTHIDALLGITRGDVLPLLGTTKKVSPEVINNLPPEARNVLLRNDMIAPEYWNGTDTVNGDHIPVQITDAFVDGYLGG
ncbi:MAG: hypothetical protein KAJ24_00520 [Candidatus Aenigmarchaeota archaeon]|nr:hypothetical protein [Candidatus Aenigmarchaeota archaeon]